MGAEASCWSQTVLRQVGELDAVLGEHGVDVIRNGLDEGPEQGGLRLRIGLFHELDHSELRGAVDGYEQVELAFSGPHLDQVDVEEADWIGVELLRGVASRLRPRAGGLMP